jgi:hypothetical protein
MAKYKVEARGYKMDTDFCSANLEYVIDVYCKLKTKMQEYFYISVWDLETGEVYCSCTIENDGSGYNMCEYVAHTILE